MIKVQYIPHGATLYTEKSQTFKNDWNLFLWFVFHNEWLQNYWRPLITSMTPNFVFVVSNLLPICCHFGWGMPYLCTFVEKVVTLLGAITDKWAWTLVCGQN